MYEFENQFAPLTQSLMRNVQPNRGGGVRGGGNMPQMGWIGDHSDEDANRLQMAQNMAVARRQQGGQGQSSSSERYLSGGPSPIQKAILASKAAMMTGLDTGDDDQKKQLEELRDNPDVPLKDFQAVLQNVRPRTVAAPKAGPVQHNFDSQTPQPQGNQDQIVNMVQAFQKKHPNSDLTEIKALANSGASAEQLFNAMHGMAHDETTQQAGQQRQQQATQRAQLQNLVRQQGQMHTDLSKSQHMLSQYGIDPEGTEAQAAEAGPEALGMYKAHQQKLQQFNQLQTQIQSGLTGGGEEQPQEQHVPHAQFGQDGRITPGSRGPISPDIAAHYIRRTGSVEAGKAAAAAEGWQI